MAVNVLKKKHLKKRRSRWQFIIVQKFKLVLFIFCTCTHIFLKTVKGGHIIYTGSSYIWVNKIHTKDFLRQQMPLTGITCMFQSTTFYYITFSKWLMFWVCWMVELGLQNVKLQSSNSCSAFAWKATINHSTIVVEHKMTIYIWYPQPQHICSCCSNK